MKVEEQIDVGMKVMFVAGGVFGTIMLPTMVAAAFLGPRDGMQVFSMFMPWALVALVPFFIGAVIAMHAMTFRK